MNMGLLDKLMFWKDDEPEFTVDGCFTLPESASDDPAHGSLPVDEGPVSGLDLSGIDGSPLTEPN